ncbi:unnamed protein product [Somion occarium]|uniref:Transcription initiation factor TFIID subunit 2 n=1 Tax=Somion occarium TaxID=3059160 RepID=A0ABP1CI09_9APHY
MERSKQPTNTEIIHARRGFTIGHQKVVLEIDFSGSIWGYTDITLYPTTKDLRTIHLNSRQCHIHSVTVDTHRAEFVHHDALSHLSISNPQDCHNHPELKRKIYSALAEDEEGELSIAIPPEVTIRQAQWPVQDLTSAAATPEPQTAGPTLSSKEKDYTTKYVAMTVHIVYSLRKSSDGVQFVLPSDTYPFRIPHVFTTPAAPDSARCWVPCVDYLWEKCPWDFEFIVPRSLEQHDPVSSDEDEQPDVEYPTVVVCSGRFEEQIAHPHNSAKTIFQFSLPQATSVQHVAFAAGPFHVYPVPGDEETAIQVGITAFCLPGHESMLANSVSTLRSAMSFYSRAYTGAFPFDSFKLVFVDEMPSQRFDSASLSVITADLLHGDDTIDQVYETRHSLSHALACQWIGIDMYQKYWPDTWLINGLSLYVTGQFMRKVFGNNEYRYRLKKDMERVLEMDNGSMPPICQPHTPDPPDANLLPFVNLKAPLVLHILDRRLCKSGTSVSLIRILPKIFLAVLSAEHYEGKGLSTHNFLRMCRKVSGIDPRSFAEQWIYGSGCPRFGFSASFNRKKMAVEISMRQESPAYQVHENNEISKTLMKPVPFFEGQMTIRIHEADGTPYEHVLDIRNPYKRYEVPFNTKYKRVRRNTKRYLARQQAAQAAAEGDADAVEAMNMIDMGFGLEIWEKEQERENWKVADWTEEDEQNMSGQTYEWIRIDADLEWIAAIAFDQKDYMWVSQLQRDRDVVAQYEAISVLSKTPNPIISSTFTKTVLVTNYFYRIRCEAAMALVTCAIQRLDWLGLFHLFKLFLRYCYEPEDPNQDLFNHSYVPRPNDFSDFAEYFVRKSLVRAVSQVRFENGKTPPIVRQFLIDQLRYNDNTSNPYSDALYICTVISALTCATVSAVPPERGEFVNADTTPVIDQTDRDLLKQALTEIDRYRSMDRLIPSFHNVVTIATLEFHLTLSMANLIPHEPRIFLPLTREGNYTQVRMAAFDALFLSKWYAPKIMQYFLSVMANDSSRVIRRHVARNACQSLALLVTMGELKSSAKDSETVLIEEDGNGQEKAKESRKSDIDILIKALRKDREAGKNEAVREFLIPIALSPEADFEVRWCLLKLADLLIRGAEEVPPKVTIHLPPTPVVEAAPPLPTLKVPLKTQKLLKPTAAPAKGPVPPFTVPSKLKLPVNGVHAHVTRAPSTPTPSAEPRKAVVFPVPRPPKKVLEKPGKPQPKHVPKAQSGGMSVYDLRACQSALKKLQTHKRAAIFLQPVDPVRDRAPNYFDVIKNPMDLSTVNAKLESGKYKDRFDFEADFRLMISNAKTYNAAGSYAHGEAVALEAFFDKQWTRINKTLEAADKAHTRAVPLPARPSVPPTPVVKIAPPAAPETPTRATPTPSTSTRPTIKLRPTPKPRVRRAKEPKHTEVPPPEPYNLPPAEEPSSVVPYVEDDGSADLLEEVIAIEQAKNKEKEEKRDRERERAREREREREKVREREERVKEEKAKERQTGPKLIIGKRKKPLTPEEPESEEEELLALAAPAKKSKSTSVTPPISAPSAVAGPSIEKPVAPAPVKNGIAGRNGKEKAVKAPSTAATAEVSRKGKEKAVSTPGISTPARTRSPQQTPINEKKCKEVLRAITRLPDAGIFLQPVDPVRDGCPTYYDEIKHPMDFGTMSAKLNEHKYLTMEEFAKDVELVFANCRQFNPPTTYPVNCADAVERAFKKEWAKATEKKLAYNEKRSLLGIVNKLLTDPVAWVFREPVDPVKLGIPMYFDIIPRRDARDLSTIKQKLEVDKYDSVEAFEADLDLMIDNAIRFNGPDSDVGRISYAVRDKCKDMLSSVRTTVSTKRKGGEKGTPQPNKKVRMG